MKICFQQYYPSWHDNFKDYKTEELLRKSPGIKDSGEDYWNNGMKNTVVVKQPWLEGSEYLGSNGPTQYISVQRNPFYRDAEETAREVAAVETAMFNANNRTHTPQEQQLLQNAGVTAEENRMYRALKNQGYTDQQIFEMIYGPIPYDEEGLYMYNDAQGNPVSWFKPNGEYYEVPESIVRRSLQQNGSRTPSYLDKLRKYKYLRDAMNTVAYDPRQAYSDYLECGGKFRNGGLIRRRKI